VSGTASSRIVARFLTLRASRWFPTGFLIPVLVLFLVDRGLTLAEIGLVVAAQGAVNLLLEIPTGGFADALGRKHVLLAANMFEIASLILLIAGRSLVWYAVAFGMQGVYRALESGPLDAWFVDAIRANPERQHGSDDVERGLAQGGVVIGVTLAAGSLASGILVSTHPIAAVSPLVLPLVAALALRMVDTVLVATLMTEVRAPRGRGAVMEEAKRVPTIITDVFRLVRASAPLALIVAVELFWGFGMATFEGLFPPRLGEVLGSSERAAAIMGPVAAAAWLAAAAGSAIVPWFTRRFGRHVAAAAMRVLQGATVAAMGLLAGPVGLITAYLVCFVVHGAANPVHATLLHNEAAAENRTTVLSLDSMAGQAAGALGMIVLGRIADVSGIPVGMFVGGAVLAAAAPLYLLAGRSHLQSN
jgi:MFS family permease